jgi:predicted enzyme involved in methoxymalonyl-ACP biosynthesis
MLGREEAGALDIDTFLLSCRVIGRTIETAMLAHLCRLGRQRGLQEIAGCVIPTPKNAPVRDVFERHGFRKVDAGPDGATRWRLSIAAESVSYPAWIEVES